VQQDTRAAAKPILLSSVHVRGADMRAPIASGSGSSNGGGDASRVASVMMVICGLTPRELGTTLPSAT
jgi:hypothetical protein